MNVDDGAVELGFLSPFIVILIVWGFIIDEDELILDNVILFYMLLKVHVGDKVKPVPLTVAHAVDEVNIETVIGNTIFIFPDEERGS